MTVSQILPVGTQRAFIQGRASFLIQTLVPLEQLVHELLVEEPRSSYLLRSRSYAGLWLCHICVYTEVADG